MKMIKTNANQKVQKNTLWTDEAKAELCGSSAIIPVVKHAGGSVMIWTRFAGSGP